jgi:hypothetical protein
MTSHELARKLLAGPDLPVHQSYNQGDYWRTRVAPQITNVREGRVRRSNYRRMDRVVNDDDVEREGDRYVILLS